MKKYHYTYLITNLINNKVYYGVRSCKCKPEKDTSYLGSGIAIRNAIEKYGKENFKKRIDKTFSSREAANKYEEKIVNEEWINSDKNYNLITGGKSCIPNAEVRQKISDKTKGKPGLKGKLNPFYGKAHSEETKKMLSECNKGKIGLLGSKNGMYRKSLYDIWVEKYGIEEADKRKQSRINNISKSNSGINNPFYGRTHSEETRKKLSENSKKQGAFWEIITPEGKKIIIKNLARFCRENNLSDSMMRAVSKHERNDHRGWKCFKIIK